MQETVVQVKPDLPDNWRTLVVVGALIGIVLIYAAFVLFGRNWGWFCVGLALYESWTLINKYREDTISEAIWYYNSRPLVPWIGGFLVGVAVASGYLGDPHTAARCVAIGMLCGHFWFSRMPDATVTTTTKSTL